MRSLKLIVLGFVCTLFAIGLSARAQTATGTIDITVSDSSGAVVPNATVEISGAATGNVIRRLSTNSAGVAAATLLPPAAYNVTVRANGFKLLKREAIELNVSSTVTLNLQLQTGAVSQTVTVVGQTPLLQEASSTVSQTFNQRAIRQLPIVGRNYLKLGNLVAGAVPSHGSRDNTFAMYGTSGLQNAYLLDGARNQSYIRGIDTGVGGGNAVVASRDAYRPPLDAIQEVSVKASNFSARFGSSAGAVVMAVTRSGTNQIHGDAYDFLENAAMNARDYFARTGPMPQLVQNQFGGSMGGPIIKNRAWIFGAYEGTAVAQQNTDVSTVPTAAERAGDFGSTPIYNPFSTQCNSTNTSCTRTQFPNNTIPASLINATGQSLINRYPLPNQQGTANNYIANAPQDYFNNNAIFRGDVQLSTRAHMFARLAFTRYHILGNPALPPPAQTPVARHVNSWGVGYGFTYTFSPTFVNEFRLNWTQIALNQDSTLPLDEVIPGMLDPSIKHGSPFFNITGFSQIGGQPGGLTNDPLTKSSGTWDIADNATKSHGHHTLEFGAEVMIIRPTTFSSNGGTGSLGFTGVFTQNPQGRSGTGNAIADTLLGTANSLSTGTVGNAVERGKYLGLYFEDNWNATPRLTLNLGIRYELFFPFYTNPNRMANFIIEPDNPHFGQLIIAGNPAFPRSLLTMDKGDVGPRIGLSYRVPELQNVVVRAAYGIFYGQDTGAGVNDRMTSNPPFWNFGGENVTSDQLFPSSGFQTVPGASAPRLPPIDPSQFVLNPTATAGLTSWPLQYTTPYVQEWNLNLQKQFLGGLLWEINYVGNTGIHLWMNMQGNQPLTNGPGSPNNRRPLAQYTHAPINNVGPWDRSYYEGVSTTLERRFNRGLQFSTSLTYGKTLDLSSPDLGLCDGAGCNGQVQNTYDLAAMRGRANQDVRLRYTLAGVWDLPLGHGHNLASGRLGNALLGGWQTNAIYAVQGGYPITPVLSFDNANAGTTSFPNRVCSGSISHRTLQQWYDTSCFVVPAQYQFGNSGRNILSGPGSDNLDFGVRRTFTIRESLNLEARANAFNVLNHPQFGQPGQTIGTPSAGEINGTSNPNRVLQLALKLSF